MPKVLIVDDSLSVRKVVERILESRQLVVLQASLGAEAIECIQRDEPDLVLCDVLLPDRKATRCASSSSHIPRFDHTPVLLISGIVNPAVIERADQVGSAGVLQKPFSAEELNGKVSDLLLAAGDARRRPARTGRWRPPLMPATPASSRHVYGGEWCPARRRSRRDPRGMPRWARRGGGRPRGRPGEPRGRLIGAVGGAGDAATLGAMSACLASASDEVGDEIGRGDFQGLILEHGKGLVLVSAVGDAAVLTLVLDEPAALGKARYYVKKAVPDLLGVL